MVSSAMFVVAVLLASFHTTATGGVKKINKEHTFQPPPLQPVDRGDCPASCDEVFRKLECGLHCEMGLWQRVEVQERGGMVSISKLYVVCAYEKGFASRDGIGKCHSGTS